MVVAPPMPLMRRVFRLTLCLLQGWFLLMGLEGLSPVTRPFLMARAAFFQNLATVLGRLQDLCGVRAAKGRVIWRVLELLS